MKIELLETVKHDGQVFTEGDIRTVDDELGAYFCRAGWSKDVDGKVETAPRDVNRVVTLGVHNATSKDAVKTARIKS